MTKSISLKAKRDALVSVAFWQVTTFILLILLFWVDQVLDLSSLWFDTEPQPFSLFRGCVATIAVILVAIISVGNTYLQQKRIISGLLTVCADCRKIRITEGIWEHLDEFISEHSVALISHGICPNCYKKMEKELKGMDPATGFTYSKPK